MNVLNNLQFSRMHDLKFNSNNTENLFVEVSLDGRKLIVIGLIYRHPTNKFNEFQDQFLQTISKIEQDKLEFTICGDFLKHNSTPKIDDYLNNIYAEGCNNVINKPTRITETSATLLDHIYTNITNKITRKGILALNFRSFTSFLYVGNKTCKKQEKN